MSRRPRNDRPRRGPAELSRRDAIRILAAAASAGAFTWTPDEATRAAGALDAAGHGRRAQAPRFFEPHEWETVRVLVDLIIPRDDRSGSATDAGVPEFMDFIMLDGDDGRRTAMRGGLAWLDTECRERFGLDFLSCAVEQRTGVLDDVAYPRRAPAGLSQGVAFFTSFRNLTATGFWTSKMGVTDLQYVGNTVVTEWTGCPEAQLRKLGLAGG